MRLTAQDLYELGVIEKVIKKLMAVARMTLVSQLIS